MLSTEDLKIKRHAAISVYQAEQRGAQLAVMAKGRANLPRAKDTKPEFQARLHKSNRRRVFKLITTKNPCLDPIVRGRAARSEERSGT